MNISSSSLLYFPYTLQSLEKSKQKISDIDKFISVKKQFREKLGVDIHYICKDRIKRKFNVFVEPIMLRNTSNSDPKHTEKKGCIVRLEMIGRVDEKDNLITTAEVHTSSAF